MNEQDKITLDLVKAEIAALPELDQLKVATCLYRLRDVLQLHGPHGRIALAQLGAEAQAGVL